MASKKTILKKIQILITNH